MLINYYTKVLIDLAKIEIKNKGNNSFIKVILAESF